MATLSANSCNALISTALAMCTGANGKPITAQQAEAPTLAELQQKFDKEGNQLNRGTSVGTTIRHEWLVQNVAPHVSELQPVSGEVPVSRDLGEVLDKQNREKILAGKIIENVLLGPYKTQGYKVEKLESGEFKLTSPKDGSEIIFTPSPSFKYSGGAITITSSKPDGKMRIDFSDPEIQPMHYSVSVGTTTYSITGQTLGAYTHDGTFAVYALSPARTSMDHVEHPVLLSIDGNNIALDKIPAGADAKVESVEIYDPNILSPSPNLSPTPGPLRPTPFDSTQNPQSGRGTRTPSSGSVKIGQDATVHVNGNQISPDSNVHLGTVNGR